MYKEAETIIIIYSGDFMIIYDYFYIRVFTEGQLGEHPGATNGEDRHAIPTQVSLCA